MGRTIANKVKTFFIGKKDEMPHWKDPQQFDYALYFSELAAFGLYIGSIINKDSYPLIMMPFVGDFVVRIGRDLYEMGKKTSNDKEKILYQYLPGIIGSAREIYDYIRVKRKAQKS